MYRVSQQVSDWVGLTLIQMFLSSCPAALPTLPFSHQPKQNEADSGTAKIKVNPTQVGDLLGHPVLVLFERTFVSGKVNVTLALRYVTRDARTLGEVIASNVQDRVTLQVVP